MARRFGGDAARASGLIGAAEFLVGVRLVHSSSMEFFTRMADQIAAGFLHTALHRSVSPEDALGLTWGGAVVWFGWFLLPSTWLLLSLPIVGLLRVASYLTTRQPVAEPAVWVALRAVQRIGALLGVTRDRLAFGAPEAPDEVEVDGEDLVVFTARPRPDWSPGATIEVDERFFWPAGHDEIVRGGVRRHRYRLAPADEHAVIRRYVRYDPPQSDPRGPRRPPRP